MEPLTVAALKRMRRSDTGFEFRQLVERCSAFVGAWIVVVLAFTSTSAADLAVTEFTAAGGAGLIDEDGDSSDWIEVSNVSSVAVNTAGWSLTDDFGDLTKWRLPTFELAPSESLVVFASAKDRRDPSGELHTNFRLSDRGEALALVSPAQTVATRYDATAPRFPPQEAHASYGLETITEVREYVSLGADASFFLPSDDTLGVSWIGVEFDDATWGSGPTALGHDRNDPPANAPLFTTDLGELLDGNNATIYVRIPFQVDSLEGLNALILRMRYDDGFVAYLNGREVARRSAPRLLAWNSRATSARVGRDVSEAEEIDITVALSSLRVGENVLAFQGLNHSASDEDFVLSPELHGLRLVEVTDSVGYFSTPTPGWPNGSVHPRIAAPPELSVKSGIFREPFSLALTTSDPVAKIHYTLDGTNPTELSPIYSDPLAITDQSEVRARVYAPGSVRSSTAVGFYLKLSTELESFDSDLPIVVLRGDELFGDSYDGHLVLLNSAAGRNALTDPAQVATHATFRVRGSSSANRPKNSFAVELQDENGDDLDFEILGMPPESDWILYGAYNFDLALMRNAFIYEISQRIGRYAARTRFCEVFVNRREAELTSAHYLGVYSFMEKVKRDSERVAIDAIRPFHDAEPEMSGGYILKVDRGGGDDQPIPVPRQGMVLVEPKGSEVTSGQIEWITDYMRRFVESLNLGEVDDPSVPIAAKTYSEFINIDSWIDHHILNVFAKNVDALRLSTYFVKPRGRALDMGPIWDFDRSMGSTDGRDADPETWVGTSDGTPYFDFPWWDRLFDDPLFWQRWQDRWFELRRSELLGRSMLEIIDRMAAEIAEGQTRDSARWNLVSPERWRSEVAHLKWYLDTRAAWIDAELFGEAISFSREEGAIDPGEELEISTSGGEIFFTLDGTDPRALGGARSERALPYSGPIKIWKNSRVIARARHFGSIWTEAIEALFVTSAEPLVVTEIMYNPPAGDEGFGRSRFEYVELQNVGDSAIELIGLTLPELRAEFSGLDVFGAELSRLESGEYCVFVKSVEAFVARYGSEGIRIAGEFGRDSGLNNTTQSVGINGVLGEEVQRFRYQDVWYPSTDGEGYSLVIRDPEGPRESWGESTSWRPSFELGGSPGRVDTMPIPRQLPGDVNADGQLNVADAIGLLLHLFRGTTNLPCDSDGASRQLFDLNGDGALDVGDALHSLRYTFGDGLPPTPGTECVAVAGCQGSCLSGL